MKRLIISFSTCVLLILTGCDFVPEMGDWIDEPPYDDSRSVSTLSVVLSADTITYEPGTVVEITGVARAENRYGEPVSSIALDFCVSDGRVALSFSDSGQAGSTDARGQVSFELHSADASGFVRVRVSCCNELVAGVAGVVLLQEHHEPAFLSSHAYPETLYTDVQHRDSTLLAVAVLDARHCPIAEFNIYCCAFNPGQPGCDRCQGTTDEAGAVTAYVSGGVFIDQPRRVCYLVQAGALTDSVCFWSFPWDSTRGG